MRIGWQAERVLWLSRATGWMACAALFLSLLATPVGRLLAFMSPGVVRAATLAAQRRAFGVAAAWLAAVHGTWSFVAYLDASWKAVDYWPYLRAGTAALVILAALLVTSYPRMVRWLRVRLWKPLHRLAYVAAVLVFQHLVLAPFAPKGLVLWLFGALVALQCARLLPRRRRVA